MYDTHFLVDSVTYYHSKSSKICGNNRKVKVVS